MTDNYVIVVDDDADSLAGAKGLLEGQFSKVRAVRSGADLLKLAAKQDPDLILLDIMMPEMDGFETFRRLRELEKEMGRTPTPVIFLTGENDSVSEQHGLTIGASDYIRKPFNREILLRRIQNAIQSAKMIENLTEEVNVDKMTGLLNKAGAAGKIPGLCAEEEGTLAMLDLDNFKLVNDLYGHEMGDGVLKAFARILRDSSPEGDVLCRIGGDEFMAFFRRIYHKKEADELAKTMNENMAKACRELMGESFDIPIGVSLGMARIPECGRCYDDLFRFADAALYQVKQGSKHSAAIYSPEPSPEKEDDLGSEMQRLTQILKERNRPGTAMWPGQEGITWIYRFLCRYANEAVKLLFFVKREEDAKQEDVAAAIRDFSEALGSSLRESDAILQSRPGQFFALLPDLTEKDAEMIVQRVLKNWEERGNHPGVKVEYLCESQELASPGGEDRTHIAVYEGRKIVFISAKDILRIYTENRKLCIISPSGKYESRSTLREFEDQLGQLSFVRISRFEIVNLRKIRSFDLSITGTIRIYFENGEDTWVARRYVKEIQNRLEDLRKGGEGND
ncbi:MAG: diguanylate cyclase [Lachnospiraceae bacterium]|nr:diguanylate cyclase [Lachnospiraceae bacterium]